MATFTIKVKSTPQNIEQPYIVSETIDDCEQVTTVRVVVPAGQQRYVVMTHNGVGANIANNVDTTIFTTTDYNMQIDGNIASQASLNDEYAYITLNVALSNSDPIFYSKYVDRQHSGNFC